MSSLTDLRGVVDVVVGVDTHVHTRDAAAVETGTGGVLSEITTRPCGGIPGATRSITVANCD